MSNSSLGQRDSTLTQDFFGVRAALLGWRRVGWLGARKTRRGDSVLDPIEVDE
jgi:hypothetical protein